VLLRVHSVHPRWLHQGILQTPRYCAAAEGRAGLYHHTALYYAGARGGACLYQQYCCGALSHHWCTLVAGVAVYWNCLPPGDLYCLALTLPPGLQHPPAAHRHWHNATPAQLLSAAGQVLALGWWRWLWLTGGVGGPQCPVAVHQMGPLGVVMRHEVHHPLTCDWV
jgi:hypothetical protein